MLRPALTAFVLILLVVPALAAAEKRVWRIDSVAALRVGDVIAIQVKGAVQSGGWKKPRLRLTRTDAHTLTVEFLAQPPDSSEMVIEGLLPIAAELRVRAARDTLTVKAMGEANEVTVQILTEPH